MSRSPSPAAFWSNSQRGAPLKFDAVYTRYKPTTGCMLSWAKVARSTSSNVIEFMPKMFPIILTVQPTYTLPALVVPSSCMFRSEAHDLPSRLALLASNLVVRSKLYNKVMAKMIKTTRTAPSGPRIENTVKP